MKRITRSQLKAQAERQSSLCAYCLIYIPEEAWETEQVYPQEENSPFVLSCPPCNAAKSDRTPEEAGMTLWWSYELNNWLPGYEEAECFGLRYPEDSWRSAQTNLRTMIRIHDLLMQTKNKVGNAYRMALRRPGQDATDAQHYFRQLEVLWKHTRRRVQKEAQKHELWLFAQKVPALAEIGFGRIISEIETINNETGELQRLQDFRTVRGLWKYCALDVEEGKAPKRKRGVPFGRSQWAKNSTMVWARMAIRQRGTPWRELYDRVKLDHLSREPIASTPLAKGKLGWADNRALRVVAKSLLKVLYLASQRELLDERTLTAYSELEPLQDLLLWWKDAGGV